MGVFRQVEIVAVAMVPILQALACQTAGQPMAAPAFAVDTLPTAAIAAPFQGHQELARQVAPTAMVVAVPMAAAVPAVPTAAVAVPVVPTAVAAVPAAPIAVAAVPVAVPIAAAAAAARVVAAVRRAVVQPVVIDPATRCLYTRV